MTENNNSGEKSSKKNDRMHKQIFGTSSKSDFIVNMTAEGTQKMCGIYSIIAITLIMIVSIPVYFTTNVVDYATEGGNHYLSDTFMSYTSIASIAAGCIGFLIYLIAYSKKQVSLKNNKSLWLVVAVILLSAISAFTASDIQSALLGHLNRYEGLLSILGYWGFFALGMTIKAEKRKQDLCDFLVGVGLFQSIVGILEKIPALTKYIQNPFEYIFARTGLTPASDIEKYVSRGTSYRVIGLYYHSKLVTGFLATPFAFAAVMSVLFTIAAAGFVFNKSGKRKIFYGISASLMACCSFMTNIVSGVVGIGTGLLVVMVIACIKSFSKKSDNRKPFVFGVSLLCVSAIAAGVLFATGAAKFQDTNAIITDTHVRTGLSDKTASDMTTDQGIYPYLWEDGMYIAMQHPMLGIGPDNCDAIIDSGVLADRFFNEYVDVAAQRGFICLIVYGVFILVTIWKMIKALKNFIQGKESWFAVAFSVAGFAYLVQAFFNTSSPVSAPFLWLMLGLVWGFENKEKAEN